MYTLTSRNDLLFYLTESMFIPSMYVLCCSFGTIRCTQYEYVIGKLLKPKSY